MSDKWLFTRKRVGPYTPEERAIREKTRRRTLEIDTKVFADDATIHIFSQQLARMKAAEEQAAKEAQTQESNE